MKIRNDFVTNSSSSSFIIAGKDLDLLQAFRTCVDNSVSYDTEADSEVSSIESYMGTIKGNSMKDEKYDAIESLLDENPEYKYFFEASLSYHDDHWDKIIEGLRLGSWCIC